MANPALETKCPLEIKEAAAVADSKNINAALTDDPKKNLELIRSVASKATESKPQGLPELLLDNAKASSKVTADGTTIERDAQNRITQTTDNTGHKTTFEYKGDSRNPAAVVVNGKRIQVHGDNPIMSSAENPITSVKSISAPDDNGDFEYGDPAGAKIKQFHDGAKMVSNEHGQVTSIIHANGEQTTFEYSNPESELPQFIKNLGGKDWMCYQEGLFGLGKFKQPGEDINDSGLDITNLKIKKDGTIEYDLGPSVRSEHDAHIANYLLGKLGNSYVTGRDGFQIIKR